jgi:hypothetical protein
MKSLILSIILLFSINVRAAELKAEDVVAMDEVVGQLLESVRSGDGEVAFGLHTQWAMGSMRNPNTFLRLLREDYPGIYYGKAYDIVSVEDKGSTVKVSAVIVDEDGDKYFTVFDFKFEGRWKIDDCSQKRDKGTLI